MSDNNKNKTILILGGYGNAGRRIAELLLQETSDTLLIIAGRNLDRAEDFVQVLGKKSVNNSKRIQAAQVDAASLPSLQTAFQSIDMVVVASSTTAYTANIMQAALEANIDYFDILIHGNESKINEFKPLIQKSGKYFVTDGGFHPGIPAALVRYVDQESTQPLVSANLFIFMQPNWKELQISDSTKEEFLEELNEMDNRIYSKGTWEKQGWNVQRDFDFGGEYNTQTAVPIYLNELGDLPLALKNKDSLEELAMYIAGFNLVTIFLVMPICMLFSWLFPKLALKPMSNFFCWSLRKFTSPPFGAVLALDARTCGGVDKDMPHSLHWSIRIAHHDPYLFTAVPAVACILQMLDGTTINNKPAGWYRQGLLVEPKRFLADMERLGLAVSIEKNASSGGDGDGDKPTEVRTQEVEK